MPYQNMSDQQRAVWVDGFRQQRDSVVAGAGGRRIYAGDRFYQLARSGVTADRTQDIRALGLSDKDAQFLASLDGQQLDAILPNAEGLAMAHENGLDVAALIKVLAASVRFVLPADFGEARQTPVGDVVFLQVCNDPLISCSGQNPERTTT